LELLGFIGKEVIEKAGADGDILGLRLRDGVGGEVRLFGVETLFDDLWFELTNFIPSRRQRYKD